MDVDLDSLLKAIAVAVGTPAADTAPTAPLIAAEHVGRVDAALQAARDRLKKSTNPNHRYDGLLLARVLKSEIITEAQEFADAAKVIARYGGKHAGADQVRATLTPCANGDFFPHVAELARRAVESIQSERAHDGVDNGDFEIDQGTGKPAATSQKNMRIALQMLGVRFHYDLFARRKFIERNGIREVVRDKHVRGLAFEIEREFKFYPSRDKFHEYCDDLADKNSYHPVLEYFDRLPVWDGVPRLERWLIDCGKADDTPYVRAISRLVLVAAVRRVRRPGVKFDEMLIIESPQGKLKSTALKALCPDPSWFTDNLPLNADTKLLMERTAGKLIVEAPELRGMSMQDHNTLKMMLSCAVDESRMAYGREVERAPRQFIIIGTTNDEQYLVDPTGNRRYWPVKVIEFDLDALAAVRDQIWAEAAYLDLAHPEEDYIRLSPDLYEAAAAEQEKRRQQDPYEILLGGALSDARGILDVEDAWKICGFGERPPSRVESQKIHQAMTSLKWLNAQRRRGGPPKRCYVSSKDASVWLELRNMGGQYRVTSPGRLGGAAPN